MCGVCVLVLMMMMVKRMFSTKSRMLLSRNEQKLYSSRLSHMTSNLASNYIASAMAAATVVFVVFR